MAVRYCYPAAGTVRTDDERIGRLYHNTARYIDRPEVWEGLFRLACLIKSSPTEEPVASFIVNAGADTDSGAFKGTFPEQICIARALLAFFEYNTDRTILKRIASWLRYTEIEFDNLSSGSSILYNPADLMELLVRYYQASGVKSALRLCTRLRADAFDWTTAMHTFQQSIPIRQDERTEAFCFPAVKPDEIDYDDREKLINHAEMLADGVRFTLFSGLFSGHGQDLSSGKTIWSYLIKHHRALCGGTTGDPYLSGNAPDQPVSSTVLCAWTEAFAAQMIQEDSEWAADEMIRIVYNGLEYCLNHEEAISVQRINTVCEMQTVPSDCVKYYARLARAVSCAFLHAVALTENGFRINYLLPARYMLMSQKQPVMLKTDEQSVVFLCKKPVSAVTELFRPRTASWSVDIRRNKPNEFSFLRKRYDDESFVLTADTEWDDRDKIILEPDNRIVCENTHHQGVCYLYFNRMLCLPASEADYAYAVCGPAVMEEGSATIAVAPADTWRIRDHLPADIPVLPETVHEQIIKKLETYSSLRCRITMFPRAR